MDNSSETSLCLMFPALPQTHSMLNYIEDLSSKFESRNIDFRDTFSANKPSWPDLWLYLFFIFVFQMVPKNADYGI